MVKQMMHVDWPPMVDSGGSGRPVLNCASASDVTAELGGAGEGGMSSAAGAAAATSAVEPASDEPSADTCMLAWPSRPAPRRRRGHPDHGRDHGHARDP